jgi:ribosomal protein L21E
VNSVYDSESRHRTHVVLTDVQFQGNITHWGRAQVFLGLVVIWGAVKRLLCWWLNQTGGIAQRCNHSVGKTPADNGTISHTQCESRSFEVGDFILQKIQMTKDRHKFSPIWEGLFEVVEETQSGSYRLQREDGSEVPNLWNVDQLRLFYM